MRDLLDSHSSWQQLTISGAGGDCLGDFECDHVVVNEKGSEVG